VTEDRTEKLNRLRLVERERNVLEKIDKPNGMRPIQTPVRVGKCFIIRGGQRILIKEKRQRLQNPEKE
jgi:hypothetical protein